LSGAIRDHPDYSTIFPDHDIMAELPREMPNAAPEDEPIRLPVELWRQILRCVRETRWRSRALKRFSVHITPISPYKLQSMSFWCADSAGYLDGRMLASLRVPGAAEKLGQLHPSLP
jgi:hypothetical protein